MKHLYHIVLFLVIFLNYGRASTECSNLDLIGEFDVNSLSYAYAQRVVLSKDHEVAFVSNGGAGLQIVNVSNPTAPTLISEYITEAILKDAVLSADEQYAYLANYKGGIKVLDLSDLSNPLLVGENNLSNGLALDVALSSNDMVLYVAGYGDGFKILSVIDPENPLVIAELNSSVVGTVKSVTISKDGTKAFLSTLSQGMKVVDVSTPTQPKLITSYDTYYLEDVLLSLDESKAFLSDADGGLKVIDIQDLENITLLKEIDINATVMQVVASSDERYLFIVGWNQGVSVLDVSTYELIALYPFSQPNGLFFADNKLFIADGHGGLKIMGSCTNPTDINNSTSAVSSSSSSSVSTTYIPAVVSTIIPTDTEESSVEELESEPVLESGEEIGAYRCLGNYVWEDRNRNGIQDDDEVGIANVHVTLYAEDCQTELNQTITDAEGKYLFREIPIGKYCVGFSNFPLEYRNYVATLKDVGGDDNDSDVNRDTNKSDPFYLDAVDTEEECNLSIDMGIYPKVFCDEVVAYDDSVKVDFEEGTFVIDVLENDLTSSFEEIKLLSIEEGQQLWTNQGSVDANLTLYDRLEVEGEGIWVVDNGKILFEPDTEFSGVSPTPIYYTIITSSCEDSLTGSTQDGRSNVASIFIDSSCTCESYERSIPSLKRYSLFILLFLTTLLAFYFIREEKQVN